MNHSAESVAAAALETQQKFARVEIARKAAVDQTLRVWLPSLPALGVNYEIRPSDPPFDAG